MMSQRTNTPLTRPTVDGQLQVRGLGMKRLAPSAVRRAEERDRRHVECRREVSRSRIGRDQQVGMSNRDLRDSNAEWLVGQTDNLRMLHVCYDALCDGSFIRPADDEHRSSKIDGDAASQFREVFYWPILCSSESATGVETNVAEFA